MQNYFSYFYQNKVLKTQIVSVIYSFTQKRLVEHQLFIRHYITCQKYNNDKNKSSEKDIQNKYSHWRT